MQMKLRNFKKFAELEKCPNCVLSKINININNIYKAALNFIFCMFGSDFWRFFAKTGHPKCRARWH